MTAVQRQTPLCKSLSKVKLYSKSPTNLAINTLNARSRDFIRFRRRKPIKVYHALKAYIPLAALLAKPGNDKILIAIY